MLVEVHFAGSKSNRLISIHFGGSGSNLTKHGLLWKVRVLFDQTQAILVVKGLISPNTGHFGRLGSDLTKHGPFR